MPNIRVYPSRIQALLTNLQWRRYLILDEIFTQYYLVNNECTKIILDLDQRHLDPNGRQLVLSAI